MLKNCKINDEKVVFLELLNDINSIFVNQQICVISLK